MRRATLAVAAVAFATAVPTAHANPTIAGVSCGLLAVANETISGRDRYHYDGVVVAAVAAVETAPLTANPVPVAVTCDVRVDGSTQSVVSSLVTPGVAVALGLVNFDAAASATVTVCTNVVGGPTSCADAELAQVPPQELCDIDVVGAICEPLGVVRVRYVVPTLIL